MNVSDDERNKERVREAQRGNAREGDNAGRAGEVVQDKKGGFKIS